jgi:hypothetical protein
LPEGQLHIRKKFINTYYFEKNFFENVLPHELTHIILREFIGADTEVPLWFEEGVACANEKDSFLKYLLPAKGFLQRQDPVSIAEIEQSRALGIFLLENYKRGSLVHLCWRLREKQDFYGAMDKVYGIKDAEALKEQFLLFLESETYGDILMREDLLPDKIKF